MTDRNSPQDARRGAAPSGLYALLSDNVLFPDLFAAAAAMLSNAGVGAIQLRVKDELEDARRLMLQREVAQALDGWDGLLVVNDRADLAAILAREAPAGLRVGLHLGQDDLPPEAARLVVGPDVVIGLSTHNLEQVAAAAHAPIDYIGYGPVFSTNTKAVADPTVGLAGLRAACEASAWPVVAIGGIRAETAAECRAAGAHAIAMAGALFVEGLDDLPARAKALRRLVG
ncbi:MAG: thiamine phosphate synthase [Deltaproteobacteria bacterium]|nr:MAG: thiamine phosphate synthase [Deltaproteobacteria bacterium]